MTKNFLFTILLLLSYYYSYTQEQTPAIEWIEPYNGGNRGGSITTFPGPNVLFALIKGQNSISGTASISKFYADGLVKDQYIYAEGGSSGVPIMSQYASQDGGVFVYLFLSRTFRRYDAALNLSWQKTVDYSIQNATATLANGFYLLTTSPINNNSVSELKRMKNDGSIEWSIDISGLSNILTDIQTTSDDGVLMATSGGVRKYSATGQLVWSNTSILNASQLVITDPSIMYIYTSNSTVIQLNTSNGNAKWTRSITGENIIDFERTSDNGCAFSTNKGLYKYNSDGDLQWKNTDYSSAKITTTGDGKIFVIKNNTIIKLTFNNEQLWAKSFNSDYYIIQDVNGASDFGLYVSATKNGKYFNFSPDFLLFKLASPDTPCKTNFDIIGESATYCKTGNLNLSSKVSNVSMEYMAFLSSFTFQWQRNNTPIESANNYSYTANKTGNYSLKVKQQGCESSSRSVELNLVNEIPPILEVEKNQICVGASVNITAKGCDGTVVWSTGQRGTQIKVMPQATTAYNALCEKYFNNELCQSSTSDNVTITVFTSSNLRINEINGKKEFCENTSTELKPSVTGGIAPLIYEWKKDATNFSTNADISINEEGNYVLSIIDSIGCAVRSDTMKIRKVANPVLPMINSPAITEICNNGSIILTTAAKENAYQWLINDKEIEGAMNQFYTAIAPGKYQVKVTNTDNCSSISGNSITVLQHLVLQPSIRQSGDSLISSAVAGNKWYLNGNELPITAQKIKFTEVGIYQVKVIEKGCESALSVTFLPIALANEHETAYIQIYPNPASDKAFIKSSKVFSYQLIDVTGRLLNQSNAKSFSHTIDLYRFSSGIYFVILQEENGNNFVRKLSVNR